MKTSSLKIKRLNRHGIELLTPCPLSQRQYCTTGCGKEEVVINVQ